LIPRRCRIPTSTSSQPEVGDGSHLSARIAPGRVPVYADRLAERLSQFDRLQRIDGAAVFALRQNVDLYRREFPGAPPSEPGSQKGV
jgi:hypothetical protein